jgi:dihydrofolate reductase
MKASVYVATSLDGFIAREDGAIDWLPGLSAEEDYGYGRFMKSVDALVLGRKTYETALGLGPWPYKKPVVVLSRSGIRIRPELAGSVETMSCPPAEVLGLLEARGIRHVYVDGGRTIQAFLDAGLVQELIITRVPVLLGRGIPLFGPRVGDIHLRHVETKAFGTGMVQSRYEVVGATTRRERGSKPPGEGDP